MDTSRCSKLLELHPWFSVVARPMGQGYGAKRCARTADSPMQVRTTEAGSALCTTMAFEKREGKS